MILEESVLIKKLRAGCLNLEKPINYFNEATAAMLNNYFSDYFSDYFTELFSVFIKVNSKGKALCT